MNETNKEKQARFIFEEGQKRLDSGISSYDAIAGKAFVLLSISIPLMAALIGYCIANPSLSSPPFYAALAYAFPLLYSSWVLWDVVTISPLHHNGRRPSEYRKGGIDQMTMTEAYELESDELEQSIADNKKHNVGCAAKLRRGMLVFLLAPLGGLAILAICGSILGFQTPKTDLLPAARQEHVLGRHSYLRGYF